MISSVSMLSNNNVSFGDKYNISGNLIKHRSFMTELREILSQKSTRSTIRKPFEYKLDANEDGSLNLETSALREDVYMSIAEAGYRKETTQGHYPAPWAKSDGERIYGILKDLLAKESVAEKEVEHIDLNG